MARYARGRRTPGAQVKAFYQRHAALHGRLPGSMKVTMMGWGRGGGYILRQEKNRRKYPKQGKSTKLEPGL